MRELKNVQTQGTQKEEEKNGEKEEKYFIVKQKVRSINLMSKELYFWGIFGFFQYLGGFLGNGFILLYFLKKLQIDWNSNSKTKSN